MGFGRSSVMVVSLCEKRRSNLLRHSHGHRGRPTVTTLREDSSIQMQCLAQIRAFQHAAKPTDLVWRLEEWVITVNGRVLLPNDILDFADRFGRDIPHPL